jgi:hypothetical protein
MVPPGKTGFQKNAIPSLKGIGAARSHHDQQKPLSILTTLSNQAKQ